MAGSLLLLAVLTLCTVVSCLLTDCGFVIPRMRRISLFEDVKLSDGSTIRVVQSSWLDTATVYYHGQGGCYVNTAPVRESSERQIKKPATLMFKPDLVIVRNQVRGPTPASDKRNVLYGLMMAGIPAVNTLESTYLDLERPLMYNELRKIESAVGHDAFPVIPQNFYSSSNQMVIPPPMPAVIKVSHAHAGMGKIRVHNPEGFQDMSTVIALHSDYCTAETYIPSEYGIRVQKIGDSYRVLKKVFTGSGWKSHFGGADLQEIPLTNRYKRWADLCAHAYGGLDLLAVDALHGKDGKDWILELNTTAIGVQPKDWTQDSLAVRKVAIERLEAIYIAKTHASATEAARAAAIATTSGKPSDEEVVAAEIAKHAARRAEAKQRDESKKQTQHASKSKSSPNVNANDNGGGIPWRSILDAGLILVFLYVCAVVTVLLARSK